MYIMVSSCVTAELETSSLKDLRHSVSSRIHKTGFTKHVTS